jgi:putative heme-binding domain-containing protein
MEFQKMSRWNRMWPVTCWTAILIGLACAPLSTSCADDPLPQKRSPWTASRIVGNPEPPKQFRFERIFPNVHFTQPTELLLMPDGKRWVVLEQQGKIFSFHNRQDVSSADLMFDLKTDLKTISKTANATRMGEAYGIVFHPEFQKNRYVYVCYIVESGKGDQLPDGTRVSRFTMLDTDPPRLDPDSEQIVITWLQGGHNGGCLRFGPDRMLYVATGDGSFPNPPDALLAGQDMSTLLCKIFRINVDQLGPNGEPYSIPADNPFVDLEGARGETWCYGFRNPWKMSFDRASGDLWTADVGWETFELVHRVEKAGNYGWSIMEGTQRIREELKPGPTPISPPTVEHSHVEAASITGGFVYRGKKFPDLTGAYVYGDWESRRIWGARLSSSGEADVKEVAEPTVRLVAMAEDIDGELYAIDYDEGTIHSLVPNEDFGRTTTFPTKLSDTGLFSSLPAQTPREGVVPFRVTAEQWADGATAQQWIALPGESSVKWFSHDIPIAGSMFATHMVWPKDAVLAKTLSREVLVSGKPTNRNIETQILHYDGRFWRAYSYAWNDEQTDAELMPAEGAIKKLAIADPHLPGATSELAWRFVGRAECTRCHNSWSRYALGFNPLQLANVDHGEQLKRLTSLNYLSPPLVRNNDTKEESPAKGYTPPTPLVSYRDTSASLTDRAKAYLHVNCGHCHQMGAGGAADLDLSWGVPLDKSKLLDARPLQGTLGIAHGRLIAPGDPLRSILMHRIARQGRGRMPHIGSDLCDPEGVRLVSSWIASLAPDKATYSSFQIPEVASSEQIQASLTQPERALEWSLLLNDDRVPDFMREAVLGAAAQLDDPERRGLFERFLPADQRKLQRHIVLDRRKLLAMTGDAMRGQQWFLQEKSAQCRNCHKVGNNGGEIGPSLDGIGKRLTRAKLLESLLEPSKTLEPKWVSHVIETGDGRIVIGLLHSETVEGIVLKSPQGKLQEVPTDEIERHYTTRTSIMPEGQVQGLEEQTIADLLAWLESLR